MPFRGSTGMPEHGGGGNAYNPTIDEQLDGAFMFVGVKLVDIGFRRDTYKGKERTTRSARLTGYVAGPNGEVELWIDLTLADGDRSKLHKYADAARATRGLPPIAKGESWDPTEFLHAPVQVTLRSTARERDGFWVNFVGDPVPLMQGTPTAECLLQFMFADVDARAEPFAWMPDTEVALARQRLEGLMGDPASAAMRQHERQPATVEVPSDALTLTQTAPPTPVRADGEESARHSKQQYDRAKRHFADTFMTVIKIKLGADDPKVGQRVAVAAFWELFDRIDLFSAMHEQTRREEAITTEQYDAASEVLDRYMRGVWSPYDGDQAEGGTA